MAKRQRTIQQYVDHYFSEQEVTQPLKQEIYWKKLIAKFGKLAKEFSDCVEQRESGVKIDPYSLKNQSLEFSDAITSQADSPRLKKFFSWFLKQGIDLNEKTFLDFGCDSGLLACFIAQTFPAAQVVGLDPCADAIAVATQRANRSNLRNVSFFTGTLGQYLERDRSARFDVVTSLLVFHELLAGGHIGDQASFMTEGLYDFSLASADKASPITLDCIELRQIAELLSDDGRYISLDRWGGSAQLLRWVRVCESAGLRIAPQESFMLSFKDGFRGTQTMPISVFFKGAEKDSLARASDILALYSYPEFLKLAGLQVIEQKDVAELLYESLCKEHFYVEKVIYNDGSGVMMTYVGVAAGIGYIYNTTNRGYRRLFLLPAISLIERVDDIKTLRTQSENAGRVSYTTHNENLKNNLGVNL